MYPNRIWHLSAVLLLLSTFVLPAAAQDPGPGGAGSEEAIRQDYRIPLPPTQEIQARSSVISPGISISSPTGFGAGSSDAFVGVAYQARTRTFTRQDGGVAAGFGVGDPGRYVGLETVVTSFGTVRSFGRGGVSFKAHRLVPGNASVAIGWENAILWRANRDHIATDAGRSLYGTATKVFFLRQDGTHPLSTLAVTVGAGNGRFRRERDIVDDHSTLNPFGSVSVRLARSTSLIADWTGQDLAAGFSIVPLRDRPLFITPAVADLTSRPRFIVGVGYGFSYSGIF